MSINHIEKIQPSRIAQKNQKSLSSIFGISEIQKTQSKIYLQNQKV